MKTIYILSKDTKNEKVNLDAFENYPTQRALIDSIFGKYVDLLELSNKELLHYIFELQESGDTRFDGATYKIEMKELKEGK